MSTFQGTISEIPGISIDRFDGDNLESQAFFLSHCHTDHMVGLNNPNGLPQPLYASEISAVFVKKLFPKITNIIQLEIGVPKSICLKDSQDILVTAIPAGHCPGSVMFLLENNSYKVLYTGDFRLSPKDLRNLLPLKDIELDSLYLDTTFFHKDFLHFPQQGESLNVICDLIKEWIQKGPKYFISIRIPARFGSEYLFMEIFKSIGMAVHVKESEYSKYKYLASMDSCVTKDPKETQIHGCKMGVGNYHALNCREIEEPQKYMRVIRPSAIRWRKWQPNKDISTKIGNFDEVYGVCYSNHASCTEINDLLQYLKPKSVKFNVIPDFTGGSEDDEMTRMKTLLDEILAGQNESEERNELNFSFKNISKKAKAKERLRIVSSDSSDDDEAQSQLPKRTKT